LRVRAPARFVDEGELVTELLRKKYGWQKRGLDAFNSFMRRMQRRPKAQAAYIEITDQQQV
jgi:hypothetical protein